MPDVAKAKEEGKQPPKGPNPPQQVPHSHTPSALYNGMIAPLLPYAISGAIWYQGESNAGRAWQYRDLYADMMVGTFREDLFYRLAVINLSLPPLRERPEDIRWLTERMLQQLTVEQGRPIAVSEAFMRDVLGRSWKGNARELRSYLEQAVVLSDEGVLDLPAHPTLADRLDPDAGPFIPLQAMIEETERVHIQRALGRTSGSVSKTADLLGISRKTLWEKMKRLRIGSNAKDSSGVDAV